MPRVTDAHLAARREQILEAAMERFADGGFHATGMAEVITATGLSAGAVYRYFASKEELIRAIVQERVLSAAAEAFEQAVHDGIDDPAEAVSAAIGIVERLGADKGVDLTRIAVQAWGEALRNPTILELARDAYATIRGYLAAVVRRGQEHGQVDAAADPDELAKAMFALVMGYLLQRLIMGDVDRETYTAAVHSLVGTPNPALTTKAPRRA